MADREKSAFRTALRRGATLALTLVILGGAGAAVLTGHAFLSAESAAAPGSFAPRTAVGIMQVEVTEGYTVTRRFTGQVEATARTDLGFEFGGRVTEILVEEGDLVPEGAILARLDTTALIPERAALEADLAALAADAELARLTLARTDALTERGFRSVAAQDDARLALARIEAGIAATRARIAGVDVRLDKSALVAPFAARIGARLADPGQTGAAGQTVLVLFDAGPARARVGLPPDLEPSESTITRRNGERVNTVQAYLMPGVLPAVALAGAMAVLEAERYVPPQGIRLETGGDSDARNSTVQALVAPLGLIITLSIAVVVMTFNSFRLTLIAFTVAGLSAGLSMLAPALFGYPFGINAIIGVIGSVGVSINAALIVLSGLQADARASAGDRAAMVEVVAGSVRHITSTTITTVGGFLPLILGGGGFWPPFAISVTGGVALSVTLAFAFTPQMFALTLPRRKSDAGARVAVQTTRSTAPLRLAGE